MQGTPEEGRRFLHENTARISTLRTKEGTLDFEGYRLAEAADTLLSGTEGYLGSIAAGSDVRTYFGTSPLAEGEHPDRDVVVIMRNIECIPDAPPPQAYENKNSGESAAERKVRHFSRKVAREVGQVLRGENPVDVSVGFFDGAKTVRHTIDGLTGTAAPDDWWLFIFSQSAFGSGIAPAREIAAQELKQFAPDKQRAIIAGFARMMVDKEKRSFLKDRGAEYQRFSGITDAQIEESFQKRRELWAEQIRQALRLDARAL